VSQGAACIDEVVAPAPVGILRAAAWPIETLADFGSEALARLALEVGDLSGRTLDQTYLELWQETVARERQLLWRATADDPRFLKALLFSNPTLYERVRRASARRHGPVTKALRKLEFTLYRYLARAVGRTTPLGLWAGVSTVPFSNQGLRRSTAPRYAVAPDLRPFETLLRALATREPYRTSALRTLNPTLQASAGGGWEFWARGRSGGVERRRIAHSRELAAVLDVLADGTRGTLTELSRRVLGARRKAGAECPDSEVIGRMLEALADGGALIGGLALPSRYSTAWEALQSAEAELADADRRHWRAARTALHEICTALADGLEAMPVERIETLMSAAEAEVRRLADALGATMPAMNYPALRCDLGAPFEVSLDLAQRKQLLETLRDYEIAWIRAASPWTAWRRLRHAERLRRLALGVPLGGVVASSTAGDGLEVFEAELRARLDEWQRTIGSAADDVVLDARPASADARGAPTNPLVQAEQAGDSLDNTSSSPLGCLYVGLQEDFALDVRGVSDDAATAFARFATALGTTEALTSWLSRSLIDLEAEHGIEMVELDAPFEPNPNALARPLLECPVADPWNTGRLQDTALVGGVIRIDARTRLPLLSLRDRPRPIAVFSFASAHLAAIDPVAGQLLETTFHETTSGSFQALAAALPAEIDTPRYSPRIRLGGGAVIRRRRTVIDGTKLRQLAVRSPWQRYIHWQHLAAEHGWPELLSVSLTGRAPLPMRRSSPLALDALFKGIPDCKPEDYLVVEELPSSPWLKDAAGQRYVADLALPFARQEHGWSARRTAADRAGGATR